ncbi:MAG: LysR family transcriptional regulator [Sulfurovum sp.]|nr:LysR family transcriptional regulator [Sulfurovum sp.]
MDELIDKYQCEDGKLTCASAFKVAHKLRISPMEVGNRSKEIDVRISACDLGQFGKQPLGEFREEVFEDIHETCDDKDRTYCKDARELAKKSNLKAVRTAIKKGGLDVIYCELGCFKEKKRKRLYVKTKSWIENEGGELLFGKGKTEILELIRDHGSISKASKMLGMNYKKAWTHIKILQKNLDDALVVSQKGAGENSGTTLTPDADYYIKRYRQLQQEIEEFANERFKELFLKPRNKKKCD